MGYLLLLIFIILAAISLLLGFIKKQHFLDFIAQAAFFIFLILSIIISYSLWQKSQGWKELSKYIDIYPLSRPSMWVPSSPGSKKRYWEFITSDSPESVQEYYMSEIHRKGWNIKIEDEHSLLILTKRGLRIDIWIDHRDENTIIIYNLQHEDDILNNLRN